MFLNLIHRKSQNEQFLKLRNYYYEKKNFNPSYRSSIPKG